MTPSLKTWRERVSVEEVAEAPTNADVLLNGVTTMFPGTPVSASFPLILRFPSLRTGLPFTNMECFHPSLILRDKNLCLWFGIEVGAVNDDESRELILRDANGVQKVFILVVVMDRVIVDR